MAKKLTEEQKAIIREANRDSALRNGALEEELSSKEALSKKEIRQVDANEETWEMATGLSLEYGVTEKAALLIALDEPKYKDIPVLREEDGELTRSNRHGFEEGDTIQITEKFDGANSSVRYYEAIDRIVCFSQRIPLWKAQTLRGFYEYANNLSSRFQEALKAHPNYRVFGEWNVKNKISYFDTGKEKHFYVFDILDEEKKEYLPQLDVQMFCDEAGCEYIKELYYGPFISWEHVRSFLHENSYGDTQEGVVVKNQNTVRRLLDATEKEKNFWKASIRPYYVKIVNEDFKEKMKMRTPNPEKDAERERVSILTESIVTKARVEKLLYKLVDEGVLPERFAPEDMKTVAKNLPKRVYEDCIKEESEVVEEAGEMFSKTCASQTMRLAKEIIFGRNV